MRQMIIYFAILGVLILGACSANNTKETEGNDHVHQLPNGDIREETASMDVLPSFLDKHDENMHNLYTAVAMHQDLLEKIPCYCGCSLSSEHKDNYDCFIHDNKEDGAIVWDDHATRCQACLDIAAESIIMYNDGKSIKNIRSYIDEKYEEDYPEPTPTPEV